MTEPEDRPPDRRPSETEDGQELEPSEVLEGMPEDVKEEIVKQVVRTEASFYRAPVPPPETLQGYEHIVSGSAKQIMNQAREQTAHRMRLEEKVVDAGIDNSKRGQWFGFIIAMAVVGVGALAVVTGAGLIGLGLILPGLAGLVAVFVYSQRQQQQQIEEGQNAFPAMGEPPSALRNSIEQGREPDADRPE